MEISFNIDTPIYQQLAAILSKKIQTGEYKRGDKISTEDELCKTYGISRVTVRKAIEVLVDEHILVKRHGKGTFVADPVFVESSSAKGSFTESCIEMGAVPSTKILYNKEIKARPEIAAELGIKETEKVICIKRLRLINGIPAIYETDWLPSDAHRYLLGADLGNQSLFELIKLRSNFSVKGQQDTFEIAYADKDQAVWLECSEGEALLSIRQRVFSEHEAVLYYNEQLILSDRYKYVISR